MTKNHVARVQGLRTSGAAGPHRNERPRARVEWEAIEEQMMDTETAAKVRALNERIDTQAERLAATGSDKDRAIGNLLRQVGGIIERDLNEGLPVGLLPFRVKAVLEILEAEEGDQ